MPFNSDFYAGLDAELNGDLGAPPRRPPLRPVFRPPGTRGPPVRPSSSRLSSPTVSGSRPPTSFRPKSPMFYRPGGSTTATSTTSTTGSGPMVGGTSSAGSTTTPVTEPVPTNTPPQGNAFIHPEAGSIKPQVGAYAPPPASPGYTPGYAPGYAPQQGDQGGYAPSYPQQESGVQPSLPMGALDYYNEARKLRGLPPLPPEAGRTDKEIATFLQQRMTGDEDRRPTFEETMYAVLILSAQAASRTGDQSATQAMSHAAEQWKQVVLQQRAQNRQQLAQQTHIPGNQSPGLRVATTGASLPAASAEQPQSEENQEQESDTGDLGADEGLSPGTRTVLTVLGAFGLAWGGLCLWKNHSEKKKKSER